MSAPTPTGEKIEIRSSTGQRLGDAIQKEAGKSESEASKHINNINNDKDKKNALKVIGAGVALAVVVVGGYRWHQHHKSEKDKAAEEAENVLNKAGRKVKQGANWFGNKAEDVGHKAGLKAEKEGVKASEKSDNAVRSTFDKVAKEAGKAKDKVKDVGKDGKHEGGNVFHAIGNWFSDRKDDVGDAANAVKGKTHEVLDN